MGSKAPSWVDQWGVGGFGAMEDDAMRSQNDTTKNKKDKSGFASKAKTTALPLCFTCCFLCSVLVEQITFIRISYGKLTKNMDLLPDLLRHKLQELN
ncbi:hypothetical protein K1719_002334 [Acacia pycnantha]|nr:hypothetical protein K1719_002334 [Acacia pycnantha]